MTAPTGSGKTLTAFLWAIDRMMSRAWPTGETQVLYISPLRALNNDIQRNLLAPLSALGQLADEQGVSLPEIRVHTRSGDTPQSERRRMLKYPPEILITTPESLNILLTSKGGQCLFHSLKTVILDEVHAVAGSKRGTHLITAIERLVRLSGEFQRIALSATVRPTKRIAEWIAGFEPVDRADEAAYCRRNVAIVETREKKHYDVKVCFETAPEQPKETQKANVFETNPVWHEISSKISEQMADNHKILVFANSRRVVERLARLINADKGNQAVYSHHGSLSREIREVVEKRLKAGHLEGIVATNSLELGIDVGAIDEVLLVGTPPSVLSSVQRIGRAGHRVGQTSRGKLYPVHSQDIVDAAVVVQTMLEGDVEPTTPLNAPLDVLAQVILSMTATEEWNLDALYDFFKQTDPFSSLSRSLFNLVVDMLSGRYAGTRIPELKPRLAVDKGDNTVRARPGTARLLYMSGGTIPDRGYYKLRLIENRSVIGELDEEFVWERTVGETFTLGVQSWRIVRISHNDVWVERSRSPSAMTPFWGSEERAYGLWFATRLGRFLLRANKELDNPTFQKELEQIYCLDQKAAMKLVHFLKSQKTATGCDLPHRNHLVIEQVVTPKSKGVQPMAILHTQWGGRINRPFALALSAALEEFLHTSIEVVCDDRCVAVELKEPLDGNTLLHLVRPKDIDRLVRKKLDKTGLFGAQFRENAGRALLLPRSGFGRRTPLWLNRQRAKDLLEAVSPYNDFPILLETYRTCLNDHMDLDGLAQLLGELEQGDIGVTEVECSSPSPFASEIIWKRTNTLMYEDDTPPPVSTGLSPELLREVVFSSQLRPKIPDHVVLQLTQKLKRVFPGYSPRDTDELVEWVKERVLIPKDEWNELMAAMERDHKVNSKELVNAADPKLVAMGTTESPAALWVCATQDVPRLCYALEIGKSKELMSAALDGDHASPAAQQLYERLASSFTPDHPDENEAWIALLVEWLRFYGPLTPECIARTIGVSLDKVNAALLVLIETQHVVIDKITENAKSEEISDADNLVRLLRLARKESRPSFEQLPLDALPLFLATQQKIASNGDEEALQDVLETLFVYPASADTWEEEIFPARLKSYCPAWLDRLLMETDLNWLGSTKQKVAFAIADDTALLEMENEEQETEKALLAKIFPDVPGRFSVADLHANANAFSFTTLSQHLWSLAWQGLISNESFAPVRQGIQNKFKKLDGKVLTQKRRRPRGPRGTGAARWQSKKPFSGAWFRLPRVEESLDAMELEEINKDRARILLDRYGIIFRQLLLREAPALRWKSLFRTLRLLELSGEVVAGMFFDGLPGLQFISKRALALMKDGLPQDHVYWMNATDPASLSGLGLDKLALPRRVPSNHMVFHGHKLVLVSERRAKSLEFKVDPDHPDLQRYLHFIHVMLTREARPVRSVIIEKINNQPSITSPYRKTFETQFATQADHRSLYLTKKY